MCTIYNVGGLKMFFMLSLSFSSLSVQSMKCLKCLELSRNHRRLVQVLGWTLVVEISATLNKTQQLLFYQCPALILSRILLLVAQLLWALRSVVKLTQRMLIYERRAFVVATYSLLVLGQMALDP